MLDRLPPEILDTILVLTYPPSPWPDKDDVDKERRQNLRSLSLVSKAVGTRAQLLLWREFVVGHYHSLAAAGRGLNRQKSLAAEVRTVRAYGAAAVLEVFSKRKTCTGTRNLQVARGWLSWKHVRGLPVETVQLRDLELLVPSELKPLNLVRLALVDIKVTSVDIERLLHIDVFWHDEVDGQPVFPKAFLAYAKRLKAEGEAEAANEVTSEATATRSGYVGGQARR
ncbi:hypothetical protein JCM8097_006606 [Rhodosporidiobolus ruineniae]